MELESWFEFLPEGTIRIKGTRVRIDIIIDKYHEGYGPELIAQHYPALNLKQIYVAITSKFQKWLSGSKDQDPSNHNAFSTFNVQRSTFNVKLAYLLNQQKLDE